MKTAKKSKKPEIFFGKHPKSIKLSSETLIKNSNQLSWINVSLNFEKNLENLRLLAILLYQDQLEGTLPKIVNFCTILKVYKNRLKH